MRKGRTEKFALLHTAFFVGLGAMLLRIGWVLWAHVTPISDFQTYDEIAWQWARGIPFTSAYRTPGYPVFLGAIYTLFGHSFKAAGLVHALLGGLTSGMVVLLAGQLLSRRTAALAGLFYALSPTSLAYTPVLASENLAAPLVVAGLLLLGLAHSHAGKARFWFAAGSGAALGALLLVRPAGLFFLPAWVLLALYNPQWKQWRVGQPVVLLLACVVVLSPWLLHLHRLGVSPFKLSTVGGVNIWSGNNPEATKGGNVPSVSRTIDVEGLSEGERDARYQYAALAWIRTHPERYLQLCRVRAMVLLGGQADNWAAKFLLPTSGNDVVIAAAYNQLEGIPTTPEVVAQAEKVQGRNIYALTAVRVVLAPLMLFAFVLSWQRWREFALPVWPALCYLAGLSLTFAKARFRELSDPLLFIPLAALCADLFFNTAELGQWPSRKIRLGIAIVLVVASFVVHITRYANAWYQLPAFP